MRKILSLFFSIVLLVSIIPSSVFANSYKISQVDNLFDYIKQSMSEEFDLAYDQVLSTDYVDEVRVLLDDSYKDIMDTINNADSISDIADLEWLSLGLISYSDEIYFKKLYFIMLMDFSYPVVWNNTDFDVIKNKAIQNIDDLFGDIDYDDYNDYYISVIDDLKDDCYGYYDNVSNYKELANANTKALMLISENLDEYFEFGYNSSIDYDFDSSKRIDLKKDRYTFKEEDGDILAKLGVNDYSYYMIDFDKKVFTNENLWTFREDYLSLLESYINSEYNDFDFYAHISYDFLDSVADEFYDAESVPEIINIFENYKEELEELSGIKFKKMSNAKKQRYYNKVHSLELEYLDESKYSSSNYWEIEDILAVAGGCYSNAVYEFEIPSDFIYNLENLLDDIPTLEEELKSAKAKYVGYLKTFLNNKKYNQTKVKPIVNEGIKKINSASSVSAVKSVYSTYYYKAIMTINTYKITTSKVGYGSITKSKTVNYGSSVTIKITPNKGYKIKYLYVDGKKVKASTKYTFKNVTAKHSIKAVFAKK